MTVGEYDLCCGFGHDGLVVMLLDTIVLPVLPEDFS